MHARAPVERGHHGPGARESLGFGPAPSAGGSFARANARRRGVVRRGEPDRRPGAVDHPRVSRAAPQRRCRRREPTVIVPPLLRRRSSDEYAPLPWSAADLEALGRYGESASVCRAPARPFAARVRARPARDRGDAAGDRRRARRRLLRGRRPRGPRPRRGRGGVPRFRPGGRRADPPRRSRPLDRARCGRARGIPAHGRSRSLVGCDRPARDRRRGVGRARVRRVGDGGRVAHVHAGRADVNVLTNRQIAAARDVVDRYAGTGRVLTHTIVHPNLGPAELDAMVDWSAQLRPAGWKCYTLWGPPTKASPTGGWFLDDEEIGFPFLERVRRAGAAGGRDAQGHRWPDPRRVGRGRVAARHRARRRRVPRHHVRRLPLRLRTQSRRRRRPVRRDRPNERVGCRPARAEPRGRGHRPRRQRVRGARHDVVPDAAPPGRSRARARQAARRARAGTHRVGDRLGVVRLAAAVDRRVPRVHHPRVDAGAVRVSGAHRGGEGTHPEHQRADVVRRRARRAGPRATGPRTPRSSSSARSPRPGDSDRSGCHGAASICATSLAGPTHVYASTRIFSISSQSTLRSIRTPIQPR